MSPNAYLRLVVFVAAIVGWGLSIVEWGNPDSLHGAGWPIPTRIEGLPEDAPPGLETMAGLGFAAMVLNILIALVASVVLWAIVNLVLRFSGRS